MTQEDMQFIENLFRSLESEMRQGFADVRAEMRDEFADIRVQITHVNSRLDRIGGLVNGGARAIAKVIEWSEKTDVTNSHVLTELADLKERVKRLEAK